MDNDNQQRVLDGSSSEQINQQRQSVQNVIDQIETDFEKKITYISAGSLALSLTFLDKIVQLDSAEYYFILVSGWIMLALTLSINLISILLSRKMAVKSLEEYDSNMITQTHLRNVKKRNNIIGVLDFSSLMSLLVGIFLIITFCSINLENTKNEQTQEKNVNTRYKSKLS